MRIVIVGSSALLFSGGELVAELTAAELHEYGLYIVR